MRIRTILLAMLALATVPATPAHAKQPADAFVVCGAYECRELRGEALDQASTLTMHAGPRPRRAAPFYDVFFVFREPNGARSTPGGALRYVPSARAVRTHTGTGEGIWFRTERKLTLMIGERIDGLAPRPRRALRLPWWQIGAATAAAQRPLLPPSLPAVAPGGDGFPLELALIGALGAVAALVAPLAWRRRRSSIAAPSG